MCKDPILNTSCMVHEYIREGRLDKSEIDGASKHIASLGNYQPPCSRDISAFSPLPSKITHDDPLDWRKLPEVDEDLPPYSFCTSPYGRMFSEEKGVTWENDPEKQRKQLKEYFELFEPGKSLVFFYTNHGNPLIDDKSKRLLIGVARLKEIGEQLYFPKTPRYQDEYPLWARRITIDPNQCLRLPYQEYLASGKEAAGIICEVPDAVSKEFSYVSEQLTDDQSVIVLERLLSSINTLVRSTKAEGNNNSEMWKSRLDWLNKILAETWKSRGPFPGIGSVLEHLGNSRGTVYQLEVLRSTPFRNKDNRKHVIAILDGKKRASKEFKKEFGTAQRSWHELPKLRKDLLKTLCCFELTKAQVDRISNSATRRDAGILANDQQIIANPYLLCEQDQGGKDSEAVGFEQIDNGMIPHRDVSKAWSEREPVALNDMRRVRALMVRTLKSAAQDGDTLLSLDDALVRLQKNLPEQRNCAPDPDLIVASSKFFLKALSFNPQTEHPLISLREVREMESDVCDQTKELVESKPLKASKVDWGARLEKRIGPVESTKLRADVEKRAREEKTAALEKMFIHRFSVLTGRAGTGKTLVAEHLIDALREKGEDILVLAPTGKARVRLQSLTNSTVKTIHQFLYENKWIRKESYTLKVRGGNQYATSNVVVDEASMIPTDVMATLFRALEFNHIKRLVLIGDPNQLPPIGPGRPFVDILNWLDSDDERRKHWAYLRERARHEDSDARRLSDGYTNEAPTPNDDEILSSIATGYDHDNLEVWFWDNIDQLYSILEDRMKALLGIQTYVEFNSSLGLGETSDRTTESWQILSPLRIQPFGTTEINRRIQKQYRKGLIQDSRTNRKRPKPFGDEEIVWMDKVIQIVNRSRNAWSNGPSQGYVANGEVGYVSSTSKGKRRGNDCLDVCFSTQSSVTYRFYRPEVDEHLELAYAITVHKAQGSDFDTVFLVLPQKAMTMSRELLYTALTRFRKKLVLLLEKDILPLRVYRNLNKSQTLLRNTNLFEPVVRPEGVDQPYPENLIHRTLKGELVRTKSEVIVANILTTLDISYDYEKALEFAPNDFRLPDFTISYKGKTLYWEHLGMLNLPYYSAEWNRKKKWYEKHGLLDDVITSRDEPDGSIDSLKIKKAATERILRDIRAA